MFNTSHTMKILAPLSILALTLVLPGCDQPAADKPLQYSTTPVDHSSRYRFAVHPLHNPQKLSEAYQPLIDYLNLQLKGVQIDLEASRDYQSYEKKFRAREPDFLLPNPWQTIQAMRIGYHVIAMAGDEEDFKGIFIIRKDSEIKIPTDLKGKVVSYTSPTALAAAIMPQYYLYLHGVNINQDIQNVYVGSQESSIMNVYLGKSAAGATWPPPWRLFQKDHPEEAAQLELIWETPSLINNSVMVRDDVPEAIREQVKKTLLDLAQTSQGQIILTGMETARFYAADDSHYHRVTEYIERFEKEVRLVESK